MKNKNKSPNIKQNLPKQPQSNDNPDTKNEENKFFSHSEYYELIWNNTLKKACLENDEVYTMYMKSIQGVIENEHKVSNRNKRKWIKIEYVIIICSSVLVLMNTFAATISSWSFRINIIAAIVAAIISICNGFKTNMEYQETWLRHSIYISKLYMECQYFATRSGNYKNLKDKCKDDNGELDEEKYAKLLIEEFQVRTTEIMQDNYDTFFSNMKK